VRWRIEQADEFRAEVEGYGDPERAILAEAYQALLRYGPLPHPSSPLVIHRFPGAKGVEEARAYYAKEFLDARRKQPTPYMERLRFQPGADTADPDQRVLSDQDLEQAVKEGERSQS
jgi:hypothetical protein